MCVSCCPPWDQVRNNFNIEWEFQNLNKRQLVPSRWQTTAFLLNMRVEARFLGRASLLKMIPTMHAWIITPTIDWKYSQSLCSRGDGKVDRRKQQNPSGSRTKTRYQCQECVAGFPKVTPWAVACFLYLSQTQAKHFPLLCSVFCLFFFTLNRLNTESRVIVVDLHFSLHFQFSFHNPTQTWGSNRGNQSQWEWWWKTVNIIFKADDDDTGMIQRFDDTVDNSWKLGNSNHGVDKSDFHNAVFNARGIVPRLDCHKALNGEEQYKSTKSIHFSWPDEVNLDESYFSFYCDCIGRPVSLVV